MTDLTIWTLDWVPPGPRGFVRDLRLRWACEEAGLPYTVRTVAFEDRATNHLEHQPFGQVPFLQDGEIELFESGACLLHLARKSEVLMPADPAGEAQTVQWTISALNSMEMATVPWWFIGLSGKADNPLADWVGRTASPSRSGPRGAGMACGRALYRRRSADGRRAAHTCRPPVRRPAGERSLRRSRDRSACLREGPCRSASAVRGG
jgi:hypothetical protein